LSKAEAGRRYLPVIRFAQQDGIKRVRDASNLGIGALRLYAA
jgi:hypothetical protein